MKNFNLDSQRNFRVNQDGNFNCGHCQEHHYKNKHVEGSGFLNMQNMVGGVPSIEKLRGNVPKYSAPVAIANYKTLPTSGNGLYKPMLSQMKMPKKKINNLRFEL